VPLQHHQDSKSPHDIEKYDASCRRRGRNRIDGRVVGGVVERLVQSVCREAGFRVET